MKLPPLTLVAPSLCPRCDQPAMLPDYCIHCGLQLRQCGNCRGIAGPFDRYCGFCGHELVRGQKRSPLWRLWLLVALIPLLAGIVYGIAQNRSHHINGRSTAAVTAVSSGSSSSPALSGPSSASASPKVSMAPTPTDAPAIGIKQWTLPATWQAASFGSGSGQVIVVAANQLDESLVPESGALMTVRPSKALVTMSRPAPSASSVLDPIVALQADVNQLVNSPPALTTIDVFIPVKSIPVPKVGAEVVLRITQSNRIFYLERALIVAPLAGAPTLLRFEAIVPAAQWNGGADKSVESVLLSLKLA